LISDLAHPSRLVYVIHDVARPLFPKIWGPWSYTMTILLLTFMLSLLIALFLTYFTMKLSGKTRDRIKFILFSLESIPDVLIISIFSLSVIWLFKHTGTLLLNVATYGEDKAYFLPIMVLGTLPTLLLYKMMILRFEHEEAEPYVELAKSKGLPGNYLLLVHILRNAMIGIFQHAKFILWFMLSNLLLVEYIFNIHGLLYFMLTKYSPQVLAVGISLTFLPLYLILSCGQIFIERLTGEVIEL
jgi:peptide/nickel transport system permease protein